MKVGQKYLVKFLDHSSFCGPEAEPLPCVAIGVVSKITPKYINLLTWVAMRSSHEDDIEGLVIIRSCITAVRRLK